MTPRSPEFSLRLAGSAADRRAAARLRYQVFVEELGADGALVDHENRLEQDVFDRDYEHMILLDHARDASAADQVVGVYRLMRSDRMRPGQQYYSEREYDLTVLQTSGRKLLELGRSCVHKDYRGGTAMHHLWQGLAGYVAQHRIEVLFGVASFHGIDVDALAAPLSLLHHRHLAPPDLRVRARDFQRMDMLDEAAIDHRAAMVQVPALIKAYLRLGGTVGQGAYIDHSFNTIDVCLVMDTARLTDAARSRYGGVGP